MNEVSISFLTRVFELTPAQHRRFVWIGLLLETLFIGMCAIHLWAKIPAPVFDVDPSANNLNLALSDLNAAYPTLLLLALTVIFLILLPGWIASLWLEAQPGVMGMILFGFVSLGGFVLLSQILHLHTIWLAVAAHLAWQWIIWLLIARRRAAALTFPRNWQILVLLISMALIGVFTLYLSPVMRLSSVDNWVYSSLSERLSANIGTGIGQARYDLDAWIVINAWITNLTGLLALPLFHLLWGVILFPLAILLIFGIMARLSGQLTLATAAAWLTTLVWITGSGLYSPDFQSAAYYLTSTNWMSGSDKWIAVVLMVPAGLIVLIEQIKRPLSWRFPVIALLVIGASAIFHAEGLTILLWLLFAYLVVDGVVLRGSFGWRAPGGIQKSALLLLCVVVLFIVIPLIFPRAYSYTDSKSGTTGNTSIVMGTYLALSPNSSDWFIVNPTLLLSPLLLAPALLILLRGLRRSDTGTLPHLFFSWTWAIALLFIPPFANLLDRFWFPTWLDRFVWTLPFGGMLAFTLWEWLQRQGQPRPKLYLAAILVISLIVPPFSRITPNDVDWRLRQEPPVDAAANDVLRYFRTNPADVSGVLVSPMPGVNTLLYSELGYSRDVIATDYGFPDVVKLYAQPWWGITFLQKYIVGHVSWLVVERNSLIAPQIGLQPDRYQRVYENTVYVLYRVANPFTLTKVDALADSLATPDKIDVTTLAGLPTESPYANVIKGLAYHALGQCDPAIKAIQQATTQSPFARVAYLQTLAACQRSDRLRQAASNWRSDPALAETLLSDLILHALDSVTVEAAFQNWAARPNEQRDEVTQARTTSQNLAELAGRADLAMIALRRLPDVLLTSDDWLQMAHWAELAGKPDPALYRRAGRDDLALLLEGHMDRDPVDARAKYQAAVDQSHSATAYLFLGQACDALKDEPCALNAYRNAMAAPNDPLAYYGTLAYARLQKRLGQNSSQAENLAGRMAQGLSLSDLANMPAPVLSPLASGQPLADASVSAHWAEPLGTTYPTRRTLQVTFTRSAADGQSAVHRVQSGHAGRIAA